MNLKDDVYSFGFILLEALVAPSVSARKDPSILKEMVGHEFLIVTLFALYIAP